MRLLAIDPASKKSGIAIFIDGRLMMTTTLESKEIDPELRRLNMAALIGQYILEPKPDAIICEAPHLQGYNANGMQRLLGSLEWISDGGIQFIHPLSVKKKMGSGSLDKLEVALAAGELLKTEAEKEIMARLIELEEWDATDAVAIGLCYET